MARRQATKTDTSILSTKQNAEGDGLSTAYKKELDTKKTSTKESHDQTIGRIPGTHRQCESDSRRTGKREIAVGSEEHMLAPSNATDSLGERVNKIFFRLIS